MNDINVIYGKMLKENKAVMIQKNQEMFHKQEHDPK